MKYSKALSFHLLTLVLSIIFFLAPLAGRAQFGDSVHYHAKFISTATVNNTDAGSTFLSNQAARFSIRKKKVELNSSSSWIYGTQQNTLTNNDVNTALDFNLMKDTGKLYYWGLANYSSNLSLKINNQFQTGAGIAYDIIDRPGKYINISDGFIYEYSDIFVQDTVQEVYSTVRNSLRLQCSWAFAKVLTFSGSGFYQPSLLNGSDYIIRANVGLAVKLNKWLSITSAFTYNKFNRTEKENALFTYGLTIEHFF